MLRVCLAQRNFVVGDIDGNVSRIADSVALARADHADLVVFSELAITGYPPRDLLERKAFVDANLRGLEAVAAMATGGIAIIVGFVGVRDADSGRRCTNSAALCANGRVVGTVAKSLLPTYDVFDEHRYFHPADTTHCLSLNGIQLGITICEDTWNDEQLWSERLYQRDPVDELVAQGAQLLINISASPFTLGKEVVRRDLISHKAAKHGVPFVYVNQVGANDELVFDGQSIVVDGTGAVVARLHDFREDHLSVNIPPRSSASDTVWAAVSVPAVADTRSELIRPVCEGPNAQAVEALTLGVRDYFAKTGFKRAIIGLSGGIDSALTATIAVRALGAERVIGVGMPTRYSSDHSVRDAEDLAKNLGITFHLVPIDGIFQSFIDALAPAFDGLPEDVTEENYQARARGTVLMGFANKLNALLLTTGNKSELAVGYCTLYGDMNGGLAVIADVPKTLVYTMCEHLNAASAQVLIPVSTIEKPPSAELRPGQLDQDSLPPYEVLDEILERYVERHQSVDEIVAAGFDADLVVDLVRKVNRNEYKRRQAAQGIKITSKAYGIGRRYPIAASYRTLEAFADKG